MFIQGFRITEKGKEILPEVIKKTNDGIEISIARGFKKEILHTITNIDSIDFYTEDEIKNSVIGRAIIGGLLFGGLGAVIGGMSGINRTKLTYYMLIKYDNGQELLYQLVGKINIDKMKREWRS